MSDNPIFHPMPGKIVVKPHTEESVGGIWLPDSAKTGRTMGVVVAIGGDEADGDDYPVAVGDTVLFSRSSGVTIKVGRDEHLVFRTSEILCRVEWP